ncbi:MAG: amidohydrolase family protein [Vicinamibacteria bacterium]|nr:amidohydrolase family protein [Vicinamibacteria bacterium]
MIIDCHVHLNNYHNEDVASLDQSIELLLRTMRRNRVDIALILSSYKVTPGRPDTTTLVAATRPFKNLYIVAGIPFDGDRSEQLDALRPGVEEGEIRGLKLYPGYQPFYPSDPSLEPVYAFAKEHRLPVMIHSGDTYSPGGKIKYSHPIHVDEVAVDHRDVNFVICHLGNPWVRDCMEVVYKNANVYTDFSGLVLGDFDDRFESYMLRQVQEMLAYGVQPEKCLYGTDWPLASMESYLDFMEQLQMPQKDRAMILYENAIRLFRLPVALPVLGGKPRFGIF